MKRVLITTIACAAAFVLPPQRIRAQCQEWQLMLPAGQSVSSYITDVVGFDDGSGPALFVVGLLTSGGTTTLGGIGRWDGQSWNALGGGFSIAMFTPAGQSLAVWDDGQGPALYASGNFTSVSGVPANYIAKWNGTTWSPLGSGLSGYAMRLKVLDDGSGPALYAVGNIVIAGGVGVHQVAKWSGTAWSAVGDDLFGTVFNIDVFDDGTGPHLYVCGTIGSAGGATVHNLVECVGNHWVDVGGGANGTVADIAAFDDGSGPALYLGGAFNQAGGTPMQRFARWNGSTYAPVGGGVSETILAMKVFDDGTGPALYVAGSFDAVGGSAAPHIARWNGGWSVPGTAFFPPAQAAFGLTFAVYDDGSGGTADLYAAGQFSLAGGPATINVARWAGCATGAYCFGSGGGTACPCANAGSPGHGCANSASPSGALLGSAGTASVSGDSLVLHASAMPATTSILFFQGTAATNNGQGTVFGDGLRCASGTVVRIATKSAQGGASSYPQAGDTAVHVRGQVATPGTRYYQAWYRNALGPCGSGSNTTNGLAVQWKL